MSVCTYRSALALIAVVLASSVVAGCGSSPEADASAPAATPAAAPAVTPAAAAAPGLAPGELEKGIGPIRSLVLDAVDEELVETGEAVFNLKCSACHKMDIRYVGPPLGDVLTRRQPEYVMNMILNPLEMVQKHPEAKKLLAEYFNAMPDQQLTEADARAVLEYLRSEQTEAGKHHDEKDDE
jgi:mono/diheme cytochrome c family protein